MWDEEEVKSIIKSVEKDLQDGDVIHVVPHGDVFEHDYLATCACQPGRIYRKQGKEIWLHRSVKENVN